MLVSIDAQNALAGTITVAESLASLTKSAPDSEETISILAVYVRGDLKETAILFVLTLMTIPLNSRKKRHQLSYHVVASKIKQQNRTMPVCWVKSMCLVLIQVPHKGLRLGKEVDLRCFDHLEHF